MKHPASNPVLNYFERFILSCNREIYFTGTCYSQTKCVSRETYFRTNRCYKSKAENRQLISKKCFS